MSDSVSGTPVCRGKYQGTARIVTRLSEAKLIQQGDVLITISTDIGWSPYFPLLGGVVTELGQYYDFPHKGPFNNYVDKIRGQGLKKCLFLSTLRV